MNPARNLGEAESVRRSCLAAVDVGAAIAAFGLALGGAPANHTAILLQAAGVGVARTRDLAKPQVGWWLEDGFRPPVPAQGFSIDGQAADPRPPLVDGVELARVWLRQVLPAIASHPASDLRVGAVHDAAVDGAERDRDCGPLGNLVRVVGLAPAAQQLRVFFHCTTHLAAPRLDEGVLPFGRVDPVLAVAAPALDLAAGAQAAGVVSPCGNGRELPLGWRTQAWASAAPAAGRSVLTQRAGVPVTRRDQGQLAAEVGREEQGWASMWAQHAAALTVSALPR